MNLELFIARRIHFSQNPGSKVSGPAVSIAITGIALGLATMILAVVIVTGFKKEIREKVTGFGAHIQVTNFDNNTSFETHPIIIDSTYLQGLKQIPHVKHIQATATKPGMIKTTTDLHGIVVKGVGSDYDWSFFKKHLVAGDTFQLHETKRSNQTLISEKLANKLHLKVGDKFFTYFLQGKIRVRPFVVSGIYNTNFSEYDDLFILADIKHIQKLNGWSSNQASGLEIWLDDFDQLDQAGHQVHLLTANKFDEKGSSMVTRTIRQIAPQTFSWLSLLDANVVVILILMITVAGFNMVSGILILILERTNMIGILKAMGAPNWMIRKVFIYQSAFLITKGLIWGNIVGILLAVIQKEFSLITLDPASYYLATVPIQINYLHIILLNIGAMLVITLMMVGPSYLITHIRPSKAIRFE